MVAWQIGASGSRHNEPIRLYFYFRHAAYRAIPSHRRGYRDALPTQRNNTTESRYERVTKRERERRGTRCSRASARLATALGRTAPRHATPRRAELRATPRYAKPRLAPSRPSRPPLSLSLRSAVMLTPTFQRSHHRPPLLRCTFIEHTYARRCTTRSGVGLARLSVAGCHRFRETRKPVFLLPNNRAARSSEMEREWKERACLTSLLRADEFPRGHRRATIVHARYSG